MRCNQANNKRYYQSVSSTKVYKLHVCRYVTVTNSQFRLTDDVAEVVGIMANRYRKTLHCRYHRHEYIFCIVVVHIPYMTTYIHTYVHVCIHVNDCTIHDRDF